jgi:hypothetical protein
VKPLFLILLLSLRSEADALQPPQSWFIPTNAPFDFVATELTKGTINLDTNGDYYTSGVWRPKSGQVILGHGSRLHLTYPVVNMLDSLNQTNITISGLSFDCANLARSGVILHGGNNTLSNGYVVNQSNLSTNGYREAFSAVLGDGVGGSNLISDVVVSNYTGSGINNCSALCGIGDGSQIKNCAVYGDFTNLMFGYGLIGKDCLLQISFTSGCYYGFHSDTVGGTTNLTLSGNKFVNCYCDFFLANSTNFNTSFLSNDWTYYGTEIYVESTAQINGTVWQGNNIRRSSPSLKSPTPPIGLKLTAIM